ncbi:type II secretion system secretin GspD [Methylobacter sp. YRD-M1]|uniref:type II secretion system secretin GspD n=1 Tax=Methylobacter sp. YRD-M1 TaxID=2911520 RepID=UPI00227D4F33|nr:type II secretion system secretin GspD [Methylobacter sp. YRD-M1]WAK02688.1 type II secretion system secretin GspD [Methylobacter sp. YRD-M1]
MKNNIKKIKKASWAVVLGLSLSSCEFMGPPVAVKKQLPPIRTDQPEEQEGAVFKHLQNKPHPSEKVRPAAELYPGTERFVSRTATQPGRGAARGEGAYSLNFDEADLGEVAKVILSDILGENYVLSPKVAGKVTLQTTQALTKEELLPTLEMLLRMNNAALVKDGRVYHIEPAAEALYSTDFARAGAAGYQVKVIPIRNVAVQDIAEVIKPLVQEKTILQVDGMRNLLVVSGTADELARIMDMVATFDIDVLRGRSFGIFPLVHATPEQVIEELDAVFNKTEKDESTFFRFIEIERLNAILAITHQATYLRDIESWILRLDRSTTASGGGVNVYRVQNVDAVELAATLNEIFTGASTKKDKGAKVAPGKKAAEITNKQGQEPPKAAFSKPAGSEGGGVAEVSKEVRIIADEINNSIVVVATPEEYEKIRSVIVQLDVMPLQVLIDATIVSVNLTDSLKYGIQWFLSHHNVGGEHVITNTNTSGSNIRGSLAEAQAEGTSFRDIAAGAVTGGFGYAFLSDSGDVRAVLNASANDNKLNVISSPSLMVLNNQEASIQVGDEIPLRTSQSSALPTSGQSFDASSLVQTSGIQQRKTGVKLKVKPRVNASGLVIMDIEQSVERPQQTTASNIDSPTIQTREITSNVAVHSGETVVLGGLIDENDTYNQDGIPFLYKLPLIGPLFGGTTKEKVKTELVVLITPRVVTSRQDGRLITDEFRRKLTGIYEIPEAEAVRGDY